MRLFAVDASQSGLCQLLLGLMPMKQASCYFFAVYEPSRDGIQLSLLGKALSLLQEYND